MYAIKNNDNHENCHLDFNFQLDYASHDSYFVKFAPTTIHEKKFAYVESNKIMMEEYMLVGVAIISSFLSMCLKFLKLYLFCLPMLVDYYSPKLFAHRIPMHRKWVRLKCASHNLHDALFMFQFLSFM